jgi:signal transduction histidine kinase
MVALSTLAAGLAHEINNPLAVVIGNTGILLEELAELKAGFASPAPPDPAFSLAKLAVCIDCGTATQRAGRRIGHVVSEVHAFARAMPSGSARTNLSAAVDRAVNATAALFADRASVTISLGSDPIASGAPSQIERVLVNLLANAADAIAPGRPLENRVIVSTAVDEHSHAVIEVSDTGRGIPKDQLGRVFDPFFTTKPPGLGLGLGLSVCRGIVAALGGSIDVTSQVGQGTTFRVVLETVAGDSANTEA